MRILFVLLAVSVASAQESKPCNVTLSSGSVVSGLVFTLEDGTVVIDNGAGPVSYRKAEVKDVDVLDGESAKALQNEYDKRKAFAASRIQPRNVVVDPPIVKTEKATTKAARIADNPVKEPSRVYPDGDVRGRAVQFLMTDDLMQIHYRQATPDKREKIVRMAQTIQCGGLRSISSRELMLMDDEKQWIIRTFYPFIINAK